MPNRMLISTAKVTKTAPIHGRSLRRVPCKRELLLPDGDITGKRQPLGHHDCDKCSSLISVCTSSSGFLAAPLGLEELSSPIFPVSGWFRGEFGSYSGNLRVANLFETNETALINRRGVLDKGVHSSERTMMHVRNDMHAVHARAAQREL